MEKESMAGGGGGGEEEEEEIETVGPVPHGATSCPQIVRRRHPAPLNNTAPRALQSKLANVELSDLGAESVHRACEESIKVGEHKGGDERAGILNSRVARCCTIPGAPLQSERKGKRRNTTAGAMVAGFVVLREEVHTSGPAEESP
ncbi:hypothetical protein EYF80_005544 [Liparis tanakae]|uniref:Uncharacterized protein n=1 Tax=Liparis tanakae TaxID=230148 RepID=A0A4Z2J2H7_9TELE|nr:hypothetical protein EYF80_005544 [Liparis tanakae]